MTGDRPGTVSIAGDDRGRVPFAVVGVLLLVTSTGVVAVLETRGPAERTADAATVLDSTAAAARSAARTAATGGIEAAARAPVTEAADTAFGRALEPNDGDGSVFRRYVRLRIYLRARQRLPAAGQRGVDGTRTRVRLPPVGNTTTDIERAIERVDLAVGHEPGTDLEPGTVRVAVEGVRIDAERGGRQIGNRTERITTTVATPAFQLHARTETYDRRLSAGFLDGPGFGRQFAARLYPLVYAKAYFDRLTTAEKQFGTLAKHQHVATLANDAAFAVQESVFGTSDPARERAMRAQWACLGADVAATAAGARGGRGDSESSGGETSDQPGDEAGGVGSGDDDTGDGGVPSERDEWLRTVAGEHGVDLGPARLATVVCDRGETVFGDTDGSLPEAPTLDSLIGLDTGSREALERNASIGIDDLSTYAYYDLRDLDGRETPSFERAVRRELSVDIGNGTDPREQSTPSEGRTGLGTVDPLTLQRAEQGDIARVVSALSHVQIDPEVTTHRSRPHPEADRPAGEGWHVLWDDLRVETQRVAVTHETRGAAAGTDRTRRLHTLNVTVTNELTHRKRWVRYPDCEDGNASTGNGSAENGSVASGAVASGAAAKRSVTNGSTADGSVVGETTANGSASEEGDSHQCPVTTTTESAPVDVTYSLTAAVDATHSVGAGVDHRGIRTPYERGGPPDTFTPSNFAGVPDRALERVFGSAVDPDDVAGSIRASLAPSEVTNRDALRRQLLAETDSSIVIADHDRAGLRPWLRSELETVRADVAARFADEDFEISTADTLSEDDPFAPIRRTIEAEREAIVYEGVGDTYGSVPEKMRVRLRAAYVDAMLAWLDRLSTRHQSARGSLGDQLGGTGADASLAETVGIAQDALAAEIDHERGSLPSSPLVGNVTVGVGGAPTALSLETVSRSDVPAVRPAGVGPTDPGNGTHAPLATRHANPTPHPGVPLVPWPGYWFATVSVYSVAVEGEYARFTARASVGDAGTETIYVRDDRTVSLSVGGESRRVGRVEPIAVSAKTPLVVVVPSFSKLPRGRPGVGDAPGIADGSPGQETVVGCSGSWGAVGPSPGDRNGTGNGTGSGEECPPSGE